MEGLLFFPWLLWLVGAFLRFQEVLVGIEAESEALAHISRRVSDSLVFAVWETVLCAFWPVLFVVNGRLR